LARYGVLGAALTDRERQRNAPTGYGPSIGLGQGTHERDESFLVPAARDGSKVAHELRQQPLLLPERIVRAHFLEEVSDLDTEP